jgi:hypothetical protein
LLLVLGLSYGIYVLFGPTSRLVREYDGNRSLIAGFQLSMLRGFPVQILENDLSHGNAQILIPPDPSHTAAEQVGTYAIAGACIVGHIVPFASPKKTTAESPTGSASFFLLDTTSRRVSYFQDRATWSAACTSVDVDIERVDWKSPTPGG